MRTAAPAEPDRLSWDIEPIIHSPFLFLHTSAVVNLVIRNAMLISFIRSRRFVCLVHLLPEWMQLFRCQLAHTHSPSKKIRYRQQSILINRCSVQGTYFRSMINQSSSSSWLSCSWSGYSAWGHLLVWPSLIPFRNAFASWLRIAFLEQSKFRFQFQTSRIFHRKTSRRQQVHWINSSPSPELGQ